MFIEKVELENIKSHTNSTFDLRPGTTAIIGENGAGKTTFIEAVAWALFDLLDYKKETFVRRGALKGIVRVRFRSGLDERLYIVHRDTKTGYHVTDPLLNERIADKKGEVLRFLRQHMGVEAGTDLESLFRRAVGVPQGMFTAIFLETPAERKRAFNRLLKVEEYRRSSDNLIETANFIKAEISAVEKRIAYATGRLKELEPLERTLTEERSNETALSDQKDAITTSITDMRKEVESLEKTGRTASEKKNELDAIIKSVSEAKVAVARFELERSQSQESADVIRAVKEEHRMHLDAIGKLKELERERIEQGRLSKELAGIEAAMARVSADHEVVTKDLAKVHSARSEIKSLQPLVAEQEEAIRKMDKLRAEIADGRAAGRRLLTLDKEVADLRKEYKKNLGEIKRAKAASAAAAALPELLRQDDRQRRKLAALKGKLENENSFRAGIRDGLCPILSAKCLNLKEGETLESFLNENLSNSRVEIEEIESRKAKLTEKISVAREAETQLSKLDQLERREKQLAARGLGLKGEREELESTAGKTAQLETELGRTDAGLKKLGNPIGKRDLLEREVALEIPLREQLTKTESNLERLESEKNLKQEHLETYKDLDPRWKTYTNQRDETIAAHREYLANESRADLLKERETGLQTERRKFGSLKGEAELLEKKIETILKGFDRDEFVQKRNELQRLEKELAGIDANLKNLRRRRIELEDKLSELQGIRDRLGSDTADLKRNEETRQLLTFIRTTLKEAAPMIARNYVYHVSVEAGQLFREITGNADHTLRWSEDYGVMVEEGGFERPFQSLSGGEQMAAALSVRLALLKQLSEISVVFFDEPTANLDLERRERLADQISRITERQTFNQLFVVSHDDTFEAYVDNVIVLESGERSV